MESKRGNATRVFPGKCRSSLTKLLLGSSPGRTSLPIQGRLLDLLAQPGAQEQPAQLPMAQDKGKGSPCSRLARKQPFISHPETKTCLIPPSCINVCTRTSGCVFPWSEVLMLWEKQEVEQGVSGLGTQASA